MQGPFAVLARSYWSKACSSCCTHARNGALPSTDRGFRYDSSSNVQPSVAWKCTLSILQGQYTHPGSAAALVTHSAAGNGTQCRLEVAETQPETHSANLIGASPFPGSCTRSTAAGAAGQGRQWLRAGNTAEQGPLTLVTGRKCCLQHAQQRHAAESCLQDARPARPHGTHAHPKHSSAGPRPEARSAALRRGRGAESEHAGVGAPAAQDAACAWGRGPTCRPARPLTLVTHLRTRRELRHAAGGGEQVLNPSNYPALHGSKATRPCSGSARR